MKDRYEHQIKKLEEILKSTRRTSESSRRVIEAPRRFIESSRRVSEPSRNLSESIRKSPINPDLKEDTSDEVKLLTRQVRLEIKKIEKFRCTCLMGTLLIIARLIFFLPKKNGLYNNMKFYLSLTI